MANRSTLYQRATEAPCHEKLGEYGSSLAMYAIARLKSGSQTDLEIAMLDYMFRPLVPRGTTSPFVLKAGIANSSTSLGSDIIATSMSASNARNFANAARMIHACTDFGNTALEVYSDGRFIPASLGVTSRQMAASLMVDSDHADRSIVYIVDRSGVMYALDRETRLPIVSKGSFRIENALVGFGSLYGGWSYNATLKRLVGLKTSYNSTNDSLSIEIAVFNNFDLNSTGSLTDIALASNYKKYTVPTIAPATANYGNEPISWNSNYIRPVLSNDGRIWFSFHFNSSGGKAHKLAVITLSSDPQSTGATIVPVQSVTYSGTVSGTWNAGIQRMQSRDGSTVALASHAYLTSGGASVFIIDKRLSFYTNLLYAGNGDYGASLVPFGNSGWAFFPGNGIAPTIMERFSSSNSQLTYPGEWLPMTLPYIGTGILFVTQVTDYALYGDLGL